MTETMPVQDLILSLDIKGVYDDNKQLKQKTM